MVVSGGCVMMIAIKVVYRGKTEGHQQSQFYLP